MFAHALEKARNTTQKMTRACLLWSTSCWFPFQSFAIYPTLCCLLLWHPAFHSPWRFAADTLYLHQVKMTHFIACCQTHSWKTMWVCYTSTVSPVYRDWNPMASSQKIVWLLTTPFYVAVWTSLIFNQRDTNDFDPNAFSSEYCSGLRSCCCLFCSSTKSRSLLWLYKAYSRRAYC